MHQILKRRPGKTTDHGAPLKRERKPWNRLPAETDLAIRQMIDAGKKRAEIMATLGVGRTSVDRLIAESKETSLPIAMKRDRFGKTDYREVFRAAEALRMQRLAERRAELSASKWVNQVTEVEA
jgi:RIO-like serine/threonine protein kinase